MFTSSRTLCHLLVSNRWHIIYMILKDMQIYQTHSDKNNAIIAPAEIYNSPNVNSQVKYKYV